MGMKLEQQEGRAAAGGAILREWEHGEYRYRLRLLHDQAHIDRRRCRAGSFGLLPQKSAKWRWIGYPQAIVDELLIAHNAAEAAEEREAYANPAQKEGD